MNMETFEAFLDNVTAKASKIIPGAVMAVVDQHGMYSRPTVARRTTDTHRELHLQKGLGY